MTLKSCLMIKCIALNTIDIEKLIYELEEYVRKYFPKAVINLQTNQPYWKEPEYNKIIYNLQNNQFITVTEFIGKLYLSWNEKKINSEEDAVWSKLCHPDEIFLMPEVEWVNIYTWKDEEIPIIN